MVQIHGMWRRMGCQCLIKRGVTQESGSCAGEFVPASNFKKVRPFVLSCALDSRSWLEDFDI